MEMCTSSSENESLLTPPELKETAQEVILNLLPEKSKAKYNKTYEEFIQWKARKNASDGAGAGAGIAMGLPRLHSCCFVFDLKTGNILLGCVSAFFSLALVIAMIVEAATVSTLGITDDDEYAKLVGLQAMSIILVLLFLAKFAFDVFFVYGVVTERAGVIRAYFIMWTVFFILSLFTFFINAGYFKVATICTELFYIGVNVYAILVSHSFYKLLNEREDV